MLIKRKEQNDADSTQKIIELHIDANSSIERIQNPMVLLLRRIRISGRISSAEILLGGGVGGPVKEVVT